MKKTFKKAVAVILTMAMAMSVGVPAFASECENKTMYFVCDSEGRYTMLNTTTLRDGNTVGKNIVQAQVTENDRFYKLSGNEYLIEAYGDVYTKAKKIPLNASDYSANKNIMEEYNLSNALKKDIEDTINMQKMNGNFALTVDLYVPASNDNSNTRAFDDETFYYGHNNLMRNTYVNYGYCSTKTVEKNGTNVKNVADSFINLVISSVGCVSDNVAIFGIGMSALDFFEAVYGPVERGTSDDKIQTALSYNKYTKQIDYYDPYIQEWGEGCLARYVKVYEVNGMQFYGDTGKTQHIQQSVNKEYTSQHYNDYQFAIDTAPVCYIDPVITTTLYGTHIVF